jgi:CheY-like chemotaxis protein
MTLQSSLIDIHDSVRSQIPLVLVVDDDDDSLTLMSYILEQMSCAACFVADGYAALQAAKQHRPDLILTDIHLPRVDGFGMIQQLRANRLTQTIPVIAVTALAGPENQAKILTAGFDDYISKPFLLQAIQEVIQRFVSVSQIS